jgi:prephenate dehydrogenase
MRIAVLGVGLIGGSVGLAARERLDARVAGWDPVGPALDEAVARGAVSVAGGSVAEAVAGAEAVFCAAPVARLPALIAQALAAAPADCVVTDVGSTKRAIVAAVDDPRFVGGHPLTGAETAGVAHARADLFDGATWYLTPAPVSEGILYERLHRLLHALGARPAAIEAEIHDRMLAAVSHLPHVLANVLVAQTAATLAAGDRGVGGFGVGPSFRDATRVAGANSAIWTDIYLANRDALLDEIDGTLARLQSVRALLHSGDAEAITAWNDAAGSDRRTLLEAQLAGGELHELRVSVPNVPGVVAELALALGRAGVNIADMALYPAPDMSEGVIALWVAGEDAAIRAQQLAAGLGHPVARV